MGTTNDCDISQIVPNFRVLNSRPGEKSRSVIYRSSCIDYVQDDKMAAFNRLDIETIIDLRAEGEYHRTRGKKLVDKYGEVYRVDVGHTSSLYKPGEDIRYSSIPTPKHLSHDQEAVPQTDNPRHHYFVRLFSFQFVWNIFKRLSLKMIIMVFFKFVKDVFMLNWTFGGVVHYVSRTLNHRGLVCQYINIIDYSKKSVCAVLKILATRGHRPTLVCCAFGKDRTSVIAALIQSLIGWPDADISHSYGLCEELCLPLVSHMKRNLMEGYGLSEDFIHARENTMYELLDHTRLVYGSVTEYLDQIGLSKMEQRQLCYYYGAIE